MLKKIIVSGLFVALVVLLVAGAINRTIDKSEATNDRKDMENRITEESGKGQGAGRSNEVTQVGAQADRGQGQEGQGIGNRQGQVSQERQYPNYQEVPAEWTIYEGIVSQVPAEGVELVINTAEGEITIGTGPLDLSEQGFILQTGERLQVSGYWEGEEFKAAELTQLDNNMAVTLRDDMGRPAWSGAGKNAINLSENGGGNSQGNGTDRNEIGREDNQADAGPAEVAQWLTLNGTVISVDESAIVVEGANGQIINVEGRPWRFAQEQGFAAAAGETISLIGFYEGDKFEVGQMNNLSNETMVQIRQESGRPLWAGGGRRASQSLG